MGNHIDGGAIRRSLIGIDVVQLPALGIQSQGMAGSHQRCQISAAGIDGRGVGGRRIVLEYAAADLDSGSTGRDAHLAGIGTALNGQASATHRNRFGVLVVYAAGIGAGAVAQGQLSRIQGDYAIPAVGLTGEGVTVPVNGDLASPETGRDGVLHHFVLQEGQQRAGLTIGRGGGIGEGIEEVGLPIHGQRGRHLVAAFRAQAGGLIDILMTAFLAAVGTGGVCRQAVRVGTFDDLHGGGIVHVRQLHQNAAGLVGVALCQQGGVGNAGPDIDTVCFAAAEGQASVHGNTTGKGTVFHLGRIPSENRQAVIPMDAMALASFKDCVFYGKHGFRSMLRPHLHRRRGFGGVRVLDRTVLNGHIRGKDCENRLIGPAAQRMTVQLQRNTLFDFYGSALHIIVSTKGNGVPILGGCQRRFQTGVELLSNGEGIDKSAAVGAVAAFIRGALVVAAAAAVAFAVSIVTSIVTSVGSHVDLPAHELGGVRGIHDFVGAVVESKAILQKLQGPAGAITVQSLREASALQVGGAPEGNRPLKARILSQYGQLKLVVKPLPLIENILQNQLSAGNGANFSQGAVFHGEGAIGEISHLQAIQGMTLQIQGHVLAAPIGAGHVNGFVRHVSREIEVPAAVHKVADIGVVLLCI